MKAAQAATGLTQRPRTVINCKTPQSLLTGGEHGKAHTLQCHSCAQHPMQLPLGCHPGGFDHIAITALGGWHAMVLQQTRPVANHTHAPGVMKLSGGKQGSLLVVHKLSGQ